MRFATLGANPELENVARILVDQGYLWIAALGERSQLPAAHARTEFVDDWEDLLKFPDLDLVVFAADGVARDEALRKLAQSDVGMLVIHPACTAIVAIEVEMIRDDLGTRIATYCPLAEHPAFERFRQIARGESELSPTLGAVQQVVMERRLPERDDETVLSSLRRDCEVLRRLSGRMRHVNGMGEAGKGAGFHNLSVNMTSLDDVVHRWSVTPGKPGVTIKLVGEIGETQLNADESSCSLVVNGESTEFELLDGLDESIRWLMDGDPKPDWTDVRHSLEIAEAAERSAVKGKTIELFNESYTEESSFKGLMAIGGCGLLVLTFLFMIVWSAIEGVRLPAERNRYERERAMAAASPDGPPPEVRSSTPLLLRLWPAYPFAMFLMLQLLRLVFTKPPADAHRTDSPADS